MYQIKYEQEGNTYYFQCPAQSKLEAVEQFRQMEHFEVRILEIKELELTNYNNL